MCKPTISHFWGAQIFDANLFKQTEEPHLNSPQPHRNISNSLAAAANPRYPAHKVRFLVRYWLGLYTL